MPHASQPPSPPCPPDWHLLDADEALRAQRSDAACGLSADEAARRLAAHGPNALATQQARSWPALLLAQFRDFMIVVLLAAALVSGALGEWVDALVIAVIVLLNAVIGFTQARRADQAIAALRQLAAAQAQVLRDGQPRTVPASELAPGDIVLLEAGGQIPADLRLLEVAQLKVDESTLTGESVTVEKSVAALPANGETLALGDRVNLGFKGTLVTHGRARGLVVATGMQTELGRVAGLLGDAIDRRTPLQRRLARFSRQLSLLVLLICLGLFGLGLARGEPPLLMLLTAISLAVAAIPEALPAIVTVLLAVGARRMADFNALIRRLPAVETLGSVSVICSDKTGTLTQNRMHAELVLAGGQAWRPGNAKNHDTDHAAAALPAHHALLRAAALCNDASALDPGQASAPGGWQGDPTETALTAVAAQAGWFKPALEAAAPRVLELPFDADRKRMTTFHRDSDQGHGGFTAYTKGAPESVLPRCTGQWTPEGVQGLDARAVLAEAERLAAQGLRVMALACRAWPALPPAPHSAQDAETIESGLALFGLIGLIDPPREEAAAAVRDCISAGIRPVMITGDHPATALAIARRLGIVGTEETEVLTGAALAALDDAALQARVQDVRVYARVDPAQKIRIVQALQAHGQFVAMTGDGVNDAPALKAADIGVAMGRGGTDVAREASALVLLDDNFSTIVAAVREGRRIYDNIRKFVRYAMTGNWAEVLTLSAAPLLGLPMPLLPIHILWVNLVTDGLPGLALAAEPAERGVMRRPPRPPGESLFAHGMGWHVLLVGALLAVLCLGLQHWAIATGQGHWQTMVFTVLTLGQMAHVLAIRSETEPLWRLGLGSNRPLLGAVALTFALQMATIYVPWLHPVFKTQPLSAGELALCLALAALVFVAVELEKAWRRRARTFAKSAP
ncbi:MAG: cation-translocating P-type ATPase [Comamonadaceae bacterium]|nr:cation-translocating P-type ATPase [Comamonadaceae bacterium]